MKSKWSQQYPSGFLSAISCILILGILGGCGGTNSHKVTAISVTPATASIAVAATQQFTATATLANGSTSDVTSQATWSSGTTTVATISATGLATAVGGGSSTITATMSGISGTAKLTVAAAVTLQSIAVTPAAPSIGIAGTQQFTATGTFSDASTSNITSQVTWSSGTTGVATISTAGLATGVANGTSTITASKSGVNGTATLTVKTLTSIAITPNPATVGLGSTVQLTATGTYSDSSTADLSSQVTWNSATTSVATVSTTGLATGVTLGTSDITAALGSVTSPVDVLTVAVKAVTSITISPATPTIPIGGTADFTATAHFSDGSTQLLTSGVTWNSSAAAATILSNGIAIGQSAGSTTITATFSSVPGTTTLTVQPAVARAVYVSSTTDSNTATYILKSSTATLLPIGSGNVPNLPIQAVPEPSGRFAYLLGANIIVTATVDPVSGRLTGSPSTLSTSVNSNFGVVDPTGQYLYVASSGTVSTTLDSYLINLTDGSLSRIGSAGITVGTNLISVITDRTGQFVYAIDNGSQQIFVFSIGADGALTAVFTGQFYPTGNSPQYPAIDPTNTYLYVPNQGDNSITAYKINGDGSLSINDLGAGFTTGIGSGPTYAAVDATGKFFYGTNANDNTISVVSIDPLTGHLGAAVAGSPFATGSVPVGIAIDPTNTSLAVANLSGNSISMYSLNGTTGVLTPAALPQVESPAGAFFINMGIGTTSPNVNPGFVYAANSVSGDISTFSSAASTGVLTSTGAPVTGIAGNSFAATDLQGSLLFTGSATGTSVGGFSVNQSTGALAALTGSPFSVTGTDLASAVYVAPTDTFAYTLDVTSGSLVQNSISAGTVTGPGSSTPAFVGANNLAADPQGDLIYALGVNATNGIQPFTTNLNSGTLTASTQTPLPGNWTSGAVDASGQFFVAVDSTAKTLQSFSITLINTGAGTDGALTAVAGSVSVSGAGPWVVAFDPQDRVVFVADQTAGTITPYAFTFATGTLGAAGTPVTVSANGLTNLSVDITGTYLYAGVKAPAVPANSAGAVAVYKIGAGGALTVVTGSPFTTGTGNPGVATTNIVQ